MGIFQRNSKLPSLFEYRGKCNKTYEVRTDSPCCNQNNKPNHSQYFFFDFSILHFLQKESKMLQCANITPKRRIYGNETNKKTNTASNVIIRFVIINFKFIS